MCMYVCALVSTSLTPENKPRRSWSPRASWRFLFSTPPWACGKADPRRILWTLSKSCSRTTRVSSGMVSQKHVPPICIARACPFSRLLWRRPCFLMLAESRPRGWGEFVVRICTSPSERRAGRCALYNRMMHASCVFMVLVGVCFHGIFPRSFFFILVFRRGVLVWGGSSNF